MGTTTQEIRRSRGLHMGALTAGMLARLTIEDAFVACMDRLSQAEVGFMLGSHQLLFSAWSDNLFSFAPTVGKAAEIMTAVEKALWSKHRLFVKPDSREMVTASHVTFESYDFRDSRGCRWK
eukprot:111242-Pyramimonas_sp.AAC.1